MTVAEQKSKRLSLGRVRPSRLVLAALALGSLGLAVASGQYLEKVRREASAQVEVSSTALSRASGRWCWAGSHEPFTGGMIERHPGGHRKSRTAVVQGLREGLYEEWHPNGELHARQFFHNDLADGLRTTWYPSGRKMSEGRLVGGRQQGDYRRWHENGALAVEAQFKDGEPDGPSYAWHPSGFLQTEALMRQGAPVERRFYEDGRQQRPVLLTQASKP
jgi:antitoxin component YwqK of YwqJK toxin-antitoxin module